MLYGNYNTFITEKQYYSVHNELHKLITNVYEFYVLTYLLRCCNGVSDNVCYPSYSTIAGKAMCRPKCIRACKNLEIKGYLVSDKRDYKSCNFHINYTKLVNDINQLTALTSKHSILVKDELAKNIIIKASKKAGRISHKGTREGLQQELKLNTVTHTIIKKEG